MTAAADPACWILRPGTPVSALARLAEREGWSLGGVAAPGHSVPAYRVWRGPDGTVDLLLDHVHGHRVIASEAYGEVLAANLPLTGTAELLARAEAEDAVTRMRALRALSHMQSQAALSAAPDCPLDPDSPEFRLIPDDDQFLDAFRAGLADPEPGVRRAAVGGLVDSFYPGAHDILREWRDQLDAHGELIDWHLANGRPRIEAA